MKREAACSLDKRQFTNDEFVEWIFDVSVYPDKNGVYYKKIKEIQINTNSLDTDNIKPWEFFTEFHEVIHEKISKELPELLI